MIDLTSFVYHVPFEKFVYRLDGAWQLHTPVGVKGITHLLTSQGVEEDVVEAALKGQHYHVTIGFDTFPNDKPLVTRPSGLFVNVWTPPLLEAPTGPAPYERILDLLSWLCNDDQKAIEWLFYWLAQKIQDPAMLPGNAPVFGTLPGSGKGTLFEIMSTILGPDNCRIVTRTQLESRFNPFVKSLFVLGDEIKSHEAQREIAETLKGYITSPTVNLENKNQNGQDITNRMAWMFASNDRIAPVTVEQGDRRYSVFSNYRRISDEHRNMLRSMRTVGTTSWAPDFIEEIKGFWWECLQLQIDRDFVSRVYDNGARTNLIESSLPSYEGFLNDMNELGIDPMLERLMESREGFGLKQTRLEWDLGARGVSKDIVYKCYVAYCQESGRKPVAKTRFSTSMLNGTPPLVEAQVRHRGKVLRVWVCPRDPNFTEDRLYSVA
jgi:hypothetical protein